MRGGLVASLVASILLLAGCADQAPQPAAQPEPTLEEPTGEEAALTGYVTDDQFAPLADAEVAVIDVEPYLLATTDAAGKFVINHVPPGPHKVAVQKLGYDPAARNIELAPGQTLELTIQIRPVPVGGDARHITLIGEGYFACGAYLIATTWGNLHACVWDDHKPKYDFTADKAGIKAILLEIAWQRNSGLTSELLQVSLKYKQVCDPFCEQDEEWGAVQGTSPVRSYIDFEKETKKVDEDPMPLASVTFPGGKGPSGTDPGSGPVVVFQQRMTHYVTLFYGEHCVAGSEGEDCPQEVFTAIPDA